MSENKTAEEFIYSNVPKEKMNIAFYLESEYVKYLMQQYGEHYANQQKPVENDAEEFAEWCSKNEWTYNYLHNDWFNRVMQPFKTTKELYEQFKQLKK